MILLFSYIPKISKELSGGSLLSYMKITIQLWYFVLSRKFLKQGSDFEVQGKYFGQTIIFYLQKVMDIAVLREIFVDKEYEWCPMENPKVIIDLGAHFGDTALYYHARFPDAKIFAVEPSPENYHRLEKHVKNIPNIIPIQAAVGSTDCEITLNLMPSSLGHSVVVRKDAEASVTVPQISMATLFKKFGISRSDLIKFDIEGAEFDLFRNSDQKEYSSAYIGEVHYDLSSLTNYNIREAFTDFDYEETQLGNKSRFLIRAKAPELNT